MKNRIFTILASLAVVLTLGGCQTPDEFTAVRDANALTSFTAKFVNDESDENVFKAEIDHVNHIINVVFPYNYPRTSNNVLTVDVLTKMRVEAVVENNVVIEPALLYMDLTKENVITVIDDLENTRTPYTVKAEIRKSAECLMTSFSIPAVDVTGVIAGKNVSIVSIDDIGTQTAVVEISHGATMQPDPRTTALNWDEPQTITVIAQNGTDKTEYQVVKSVPAKLPNGIRPGSGVLLWVKKLAEVEGITNPVNVTSIAATGKYLVICEKGNSKVIVLNGTKGDNVGTMDISMMPSAQATITSDDKGNLLLASRFHNGSGVTEDLHFYKASGVNDTFTHWFTTPAASLNLYRAGRHTSVTGDINGDAIISTPQLEANVKGVYWEVKNGEIAEPVQFDTKRFSNWQRTGDIIFEKPTMPSNYFIAAHANEASGLGRYSYYQNWTDHSVIEKGPADWNDPATTVVEGGNTVMDAGDFMSFNGADYFVYNYVNSFNYAVGTSDAVKLFDFSGRKFGDPIATMPAGTYGAVKAGATNSDQYGDVTLHASDNGYYMYVYFVFAGGYVGCVQYDCLDI